MVEKVVARLLLKYCKKFSTLHSRQRGTQKQQFAIDAVASLVYKVQESWAEKKLIAILFMDIIGAFDHISRTSLIEKMIKLDIDDNLI